MGRDEPGILPSLTTQLLYFRQEISIRQPGSRRASSGNGHQRNFGNAFALINITKTTRVHPTLLHKPNSTFLPSCT